MISFKHSVRRASYDKTSQGRKYYLLTISFSPDNTTCTCNFCQDKMRKGLGKRFHQFARLPYKVLRRKSFQTNASNDRFRWGKVYDLLLSFIIIIDLFKVGNIQNSYKTRANSGLLSKKVKFVRRKKRNQIENSYLQIHFYNVFHIYNVLFNGIYKAVK